MSGAMGGPGPNDILARYRDRCIRVISELRGIGCVTDECRGVLQAGAVDVIETEVAEAVDSVAAVLCSVQDQLDRHT